MPGDVKLAENDDVRRVQEEARALVKADALARVEQTALSLPSVSDIVRMNRNEGIAFGAGITRLTSATDSPPASREFGTGDHAFKEALSAGGRDRVAQGDDLRATTSSRPAMACSGVRNTIAAQEFGADLTDYYRSRGLTLGITAGDFAGARWSVTLDRDQRARRCGPRKAVGGSHHQPAFAADSVTDWRTTLSVSCARRAPLDRQRS